MQQQLQSDSIGVPSQLEAKGVYVRFSTDEDNGPCVWVKLAPQMQSVPEVGTMVLVSRANDESELPEIQIIHSDGSSVVTPSDWTAHTQVGNNYSTSYGDGKSIRFGTKWSPALVDTAISLIDNAYQRGVFRDAGYSRGGSYNYSTSEQVEQGMLGESWSYGCNYSHSWAKESKSFSATGRSYNESITGKCDTTLDSTEAGDADALAAVQASKSIVYGDTYNHSVNNGNTKAINIVNGNADNISTNNGNVFSSNTVTGTSTNNSTNNGAVSSTNTVNADSTNTSTITGLSTNTTTHNIVQNYTTITAQSSTSTTGATNSNDVTGITNSNSMTGISNRNSLTGMNIDLGLTGSSTGMNITGSSSSMNITGMSTTLNVSGNSNNINVTGLSTSVDIVGVGVSMEIKPVQVKIELDGPVVEIPVILLVM